MKYTHMMQVPVTVEYSKRTDGSISIDAVAVPDGDAIYDLVDANAKKIREGCRRDTNNN